MKDLIHKSTISYTLHNEIKEEVLIEDEKNSLEVKPDASFEDNLSINENEP